MKVLITGASGFIGSHAVEHYLLNTDWELVLLEGLNYASSIARLTSMECWEREHKRCDIVFHNLQAPLSEDVMHRIGDVDIIMHFAAETHVDRSLVDPGPFVFTNVLGTMHLLDFARRIGVHRYIQVSTDEVYGPAPDGVFFKENDRIRPSNPYAASKAGADALAYSYHKSFGLPVIITRTMNNFGERQHPEKFMPLVLAKYMNGEPITIHGKNRNEVGSRCWLHARNHADALLFLTEKSVPGEIYNVSSNDEINNYEFATMVIEAAGGNPKEAEFEFIDFHACRPGHDRRYALDGTKLHLMGWRPPLSFKASLKKTIQWTLKHPDWLMLKPEAVPKLTR